jgi:hypothetical protein
MNEERERIEHGFYSDLQVREYPTWNNIATNNMAPKSKPKTVSATTYPERTTEEWAQWRSERIKDPITGRWHLRPGHSQLVKKRFDIDDLL